MATADKGFSLTYRIPAIFPVNLQGVEKTSECRLGKAWETEKAECTRKYMSNFLSFATQDSQAQ